MALYNAFRYNYSELNDCSLLVDIGARTTNLLFVEPGKVFSRSVPIGGGSISAAIAKEFNEPYRRRGVAQKNAMDSLVWAAPTRSRPTRKWRAFRKSSAAR